VDAHQPPTLVGSTFGLRGQRHRTPAIERLKGLRTQPGPCRSESRRLGGDVPRAGPAVLPRQPSDQHAHDFFVDAPAEHGPTEHVIDDLGRQQTLALLGSSGLVDHSVDHGTPESARQSRCGRRSLIGLGRLRAWDPESGLADKRGTETL
jgi:hypothetical protein